MPLHRLHQTLTPALPSLSEDLALHIRYAPLMTMVVQIGAQQQAYLNTPGCAGCRYRRCTPDCRMQILRRLLIANHAASDVTLVPRGLATRPYTRFVLAIPGPKALPLDATLLHAWQDARLWASWRTLLGRRVVGAALAVGAGGPDPRMVLSWRGWLALSPPPVLVSQLAGAQPHLLPYGWVWHYEPWMLLIRAAQPNQHQTVWESASARPILADSSVTEQTALAPAAPAEPSIAPLIVAGRTVGELTPDLLIQATQTLQAIVSGEISMPQDREPDVGSIHSPSVLDPQPPTPDHRIGSFQLNAVLQAITQSEYAHSGLGIQRVRQLVPISRIEAATLLCWLDAAGLIEPSRNQHSPWRDPRPLRSTDLSEILAKLEVTPLPSTSERMAAFPKKNPRI